MMNGEAELEQEDALQGKAPGSEIKDICLQTIDNIVQSVTPSNIHGNGIEATPTPAPAALQLLQQFDMLEQQNIR